MPIDRFNPKIPFAIGESLHKDVPAGQQSSLMLSSGRWSLSPRSTVPYATLEVPGYGVREVSWGQMMEVPDGSQCIVVNSSAHRGDLIFDAAGMGHGFANEPPSTITIPAVFSQQGAGADWKTNLLDTRRARKAYMSLGNIRSSAPLILSVFYQGNKRGNFLVPNGFAVANGGVLSYVLTQQGFKLMIPLGYGSGQNLETGGANSLPELRPMTLFDSLYVQLTNAMYAANLASAKDPYFTLEY